MAMVKEEVLSKSCDAIDLTEALVLMRTRAQGLDAVRKLNCWASKIGDVSVVRRMPNLEVCSLSINKISTLRDFAHCHKLQELYVRTNKIQRLDDIHYLKNLTKLKSLWLAENPCAAADNYRLTVLKTLPFLHKLDNVLVTEDELDRANKEGEELPVPEDLSMSSILSASVAKSDDPNGETAASTQSDSTKWAVPGRKRHRRRQRQLSEKSEKKSDESSCGVRSGEDECSSSKSLSSPRDEDDDVGDGGDQEHDAQGHVSSSLESDSKSTGKDASSCNNLKRVRKSEHRRKGNNGSAGSHTVMTTNMSNSLENTDDCASNVNQAVVGQGEACVDAEILFDNATESQVQYPSITKNSNQNLNSNNNKTNDPNSNDPSIQNAEVSKIIGTESNIISTEGCTKSERSLLDNIQLEDSLDSSELDAVSRRPWSKMEGLEVSAVEIHVGHQEDVKQVALSEHAEAGDDDTTEGGSGKDVEIASSSQREGEGDASSTSGGPGDSTDSSGQGEERSQPHSSVAETDRLNAVPEEACDGWPVDHQAIDSSKVGNKGPIDWEEYNRLRRELGVRQVEKVSTVASSASSETMRLRNWNILQAVLSLMKELDRDSLDIVVSTALARLGKPGAGSDSTT